MFSYFLSKGNGFFFEKVLNRFTCQVNLQFFISILIIQEIFNLTWIIQNVLYNLYMFYALNTYKGIHDYVVC